MFENFSGFFSTGLPSIILYPSLGVTVSVIFWGLFLDCIKDKRCFVLLTLLVEYIFVVVCSTVVFRPSLSIARWELTPFWTYRAVMEHVSGVSVWDIILNVVLFVPFGFLVKMLFPKMSVCKMLSIAALFSLGIEVLQNIYSKGISQFDDIMHNTIGAVLGCFIAKGIIDININRYTHK